MITIEKIEEMLKCIGIEYRYHHFETDEAIDTPFICWIIPETNNFSADGKAYLKINKLDIELYTNQKDFGMEEKVEEALESYGLFWNKTETYIESENMYEVLYEMEV